MKRSFITSLTLIILACYAYAQEPKDMRIGSERRIALVIGNSAYDTAPLRNPLNDAREMAKALRELGFEVLAKENVNQNDMKRAIRAFGEELRKGGVGLFYYAGHGMQVKGQNYLIPIGAVIEKEEEVEYESVDVGFVLAQMESSKNAMNIVILDACRSTPFSRSFRSVGMGLAPLDAPSGTLIAYATAPGKVAMDGNSKNGLYTQELLRHIRTEDLSIEEVFKRVRIAVHDKTQGRQVPWESSSLTDDFYFNKELTLDGGVLNTLAKSKPAPSYPEAAKAAGVEGEVSVRIVIDESGRVVSAHASVGPGLLRVAAEEAAYQAVFSPTLLNGQPVKVSGHLTYTFVLDKNNRKK